MKIVVASHSSALAGAEKSMLEHVQFLLRAGHEVVVTLPGSGPLELELAKLNLRVRRIPTPWIMGIRGRTIIGLIRMVAAIAAIPVWLGVLLREKPDYVWTNSAVIASPALACRVLKVPHLWFIREYYAANTSLKSWVPARLLSDRIQQLSFIVVCVSGFVATQFSDQASVMICNPPVRRVVASEAPTRRGLCSPPNLTLLFAGTFGPDKGIADALEVVYSSRANGYPVDIIIAGSGGRAEVAQVEALIAAYGISPNVQLLGWVSDMLSVYRSVDALLMTSKNEAYGRVSAEALAAGLPTIGYRAGGTREVFENGGGYLVEPATPSELVRVVRQLLEDRLFLEKLQSESATMARKIPEMQDSFARLESEISSALLLGRHDD